MNDSGRLHELASRVREGDARATTDLRQELEPSLQILVRGVLEGRMASAPLQAFVRQYVTLHPECAADFDQAHAITQVLCGRVLDQLRARCLTPELLETLLN